MPYLAPIVDVLPIVAVSPIVHVLHAHNLWLLGYPNQALSSCRDALRHAQQLNHPFSQVYSLAYLTMLYHFLGVTERVVEHASACLALVTKHNMGYYGQWAKIFLAWAAAGRLCCSCLPSAWATWAGCWRWAW